MSAEQAATLCIRFYRRLAGAFPDEFQRACGREMVRATEELIEDTARRRGWAGFLFIFIQILLDTLLRLVAEYGQELWSNTRYGARMLWEAKGFTTVSVLSLGIGIGMVSLMFSQMQTLVFRQVPGVSGHQRLVATQHQVSYPLFEELRASRGQFEDAAAYRAPVALVVEVEGHSRRVWGHLTTANYFGVLGVSPWLGRVFTPGEQARNATPVAVLSYRFWENALAGDPGAVGRTLRINGQDVPVVGIAPETFLGASPLIAAADIWIPVTSHARVAPELSGQPLENSLLATFNVVAKLKRGVDLKTAESAMEAVVRRFELMRGDPNRDRKGRRVRLVPGGRVMPIADEDLPAVTGFPTILGGTTLWLAAANVATMLLVRATRRRKEVAIRLAVGASRARLVRQLLTESVLLSVLGGIAGWAFLLANLTYTDEFKRMMPEHSEWDWVVDWDTFWVTSAVSLLVGVLFGLVPALQATRFDVATAIKEGSNPPLKGYRWFSTRNMLVLQQVAGSLALLLMTGYIVIGFQRSSGLDLGFNPSNLTTMSLDPVREGYNSAQAMELFRKLPERVRGTPGVEAASLTQSEPFSMFSGEAMQFKVGMSGEGEKTPLTLRTRSERVGDGFFGTLDLPLLEGREFSRDDVENKRPVVIVNQTLANEVWPKQSAIGKTFELDGVKQEVVGVSKDVRSGFAFEMAKKAAYRPMDPERYAKPSPEGVVLVVRTRPGVDAAEVVRREVAALDPNLTLFRVRPMSESVRQLRYLVEITMYIYGGIGLFGLLLAAIGLAGVTAYSVTQRTREIGIRVALGATPGRVIRLVLREGAWLVAAGTVVGGAAAYGISKVLATHLAATSQIMETSVSDPLLVAGAPALLAALALVACYLPARRSTRIDPMAALREQ